MCAACSSGGWNFCTTYFALSQSGPICIKLHRADLHGYARVGSGILVPVPVFPSYHLLSFYPGSPWWNSQLDQEEVRDRMDQRAVAEGVGENAGRHGQPGHHQRRRDQEQECALHARLQAGEVRDRCHHNRLVGVAVTRWTRCGLHGRMVTLHGVGCCDFGLQG